MTGYTEMFRKVRPTQPYGVHPVWRYNSKLASRELAALAGVDSPRLYAVEESVTDLPQPDRACVLKPNNGSGGKGVFPLVPTGRGTFLDLLAQRERSWGEVLEEARRPRRRLRQDTVEGPWLLEELMVDADGAPRCSWKVWCFGAEPALITQEFQRSPGGRYRKKWWSTDWVDVGDIRPRKGHEVCPDLPRPARGAELLAAARRVAARVDSSFVRVDLYDTPEGPVLGEITPHPGGSVLFVPEWEKRLGFLWQSAFERGA